MEGWPHIPCVWNLKRGSQIDTNAVGVRLAHAAARCLDAQPSYRPSALRDGLASLAARRPVARVAAAFGSPRDSTQPRLVHHDNRALARWRDTVAAIKRGGLAA